MRGSPSLTNRNSVFTLRNMTAGRAALVVLIHRYLGGLMDPFVTLLEVHKLMYFMQEAGQPLKLNYEPKPFGPYATNLRQVLFYYALFLAVDWCAAGFAFMICRASRWDSLAQPSGVPAACCARFCCSINFCSR